MMEKFTLLQSVAAPLPQDDIDTDIIFPARFLLITDREGLSTYAFHDWRFNANGQARIDFPLAQPIWSGASILVTGANFGCGSSREHAPWSLFDLGIRCIIAPSFGDIFYNNCFKNGLLPIVVTPAVHQALIDDAHTAETITIDLPAQVIRRANGAEIAFSVDSRRRDALVNGWDEIEVVVNQHRDAISTFEAAQQSREPWLWPADQKEG